VREATAEAETRLENLEELINALTDYESKQPEPSLEGFLEKTALFNDTDKFSEHGLVTLMTLHSAKGLEFPVVFMVGLEEGLFPHLRTIEADDADGMEEERRLFYVGMTRAQERLFLFHARRRQLRGMFYSTDPSRFLEELPAENLQEEFARHVGSKLPRTDKKKRHHEFEDEFEKADIEVWDSEAEVSWKRGLKVRHPSFGEGVVEKVEGTEDKIKLIVKFKSGAYKKLMARFAKLELLG